MPPSSCYRRFEHLVRTGGLEDDDDGLAGQVASEAGRLSRMIGKVVATKARAQARAVNKKVAAAIVKR